MGLYPDGIIPKDHERQYIQPEKDLFSTGSLKFWTFNDAVREWAFWFLVLAVMCDAFIANMILVHQAVYIVDLGYSKLLAASLVGLVGLIRSLGGILCGLLSDHIGRKTGYTVGGLLSFTSILVLLFSKNILSPWMLYIFVIFYGLGDGSKSTMATTITGDLFPGNALGRIMSMQSIGFGIGGAIGAYLGGYFYDRMGTYTVSFLLLLVAIIIGVLSVRVGTSYRWRTFHDAAKS
jgi:MFS family permease